jgi:hypothetical protein
LESVFDYLATVRGAPNEGNSGLQLLSHKSRRLIIYSKKPVSVSIQIISLNNKFCALSSHDLNSVVFRLCGITKTYEKIQI